MKILDRYIARETFTPALIALLALTFVLFSRSLGSLLEIIVRQSVPIRDIFALSLLIIPNVLIFTIPMAVLVGILTGFGRMSSDSEAIAFRAAGVSMKRLLRPVMFIAFMAFAATLMLTVRIAPRSTVALRELQYSMGLKAVSLDLKPRVFNEDLKNFVLYVQDTGANGLEWRGITLADNRNPNDPQVTFAKSGRVVRNDENRTFQLTLEDGSTHIVSPSSPSRYDFWGFKSNIWSIAIPDAPAKQQPSTAEAATSDLWDKLKAGTAKNDERVEFHRRLALPFACIAFALIGLPLAVSTTRSSKSMGLVLSLTLMLVYYMVLALGTKIAVNAQAAPFIGTWIGNIAFSVLGLVMLSRADFEHENRVLSRIGEGTDWLSAKWADLKQTRTRVRQWTISFRHHPKFLRILDFYILRGFWFFFLLVLIVFVALFIIITLFELLPDIIKNKVDGGIVVNYFVYLLPQIIYWVIPLTVLLAILINLGTLTKTNEILAVKAGAISLYRMSLPLLMMGLLLSSAIYLLQDFILPGANQRQDEYRNVIKGHAPQTYRDPQRKWMAGSGNRMYHYTFFDPNIDVFGGLTIFEFKPNTFDLKQWLFATRGEWDGSQWIFENGWVRNLQDDGSVTYQPFEKLPFQEIDAPNYFKREVRTADKMTFVELSHYVDNLKKSGVDVSSLTVDLYRKLSFPLVSFIMVIIGVPFSFTTGKRGAFYGIGLCVGVGIFYWATFELFDKLGGISRLSPSIAAWFPNLIFGVAGIWLMLRVKT